jgi:hypothetical protein
MATPAILKPHFVWSSPLSKSENTTHTNTALVSPVSFLAPDVWLAIFQLYGSTSRKM